MMDPILSRRETAGDIYRDTGRTATVDTVTQRITDAGFGKSTFAVDDTSGTFGVLRHTEVDQVQDDGSASTPGVDFASDYEGVPSVVFVPQVALVYDGGASPLYVDMRAEDPTISGFVPRLRLTTAQTATARTDGFSTTQNASAPENGNVTLTDDGDVAFSNLEDATTTVTTYSVFYDVDTTNMNLANGVTVEVYTNDSATSTTWTLRGSRRYVGNDSTTNERIQFTTALGANFDIRIRIAYDTAPATGEEATITAHGEDNATPGVQYNSIVGGTEQTMTPNTGDRVAYIAQEAP